MPSCVYSLQIRVLRLFVILFFCLRTKQTTGNKTTLPLFGKRYYQKIR